MPYPKRGQRAETSKKNKMNKQSMYARAIRAGSQTQSSKGKKTGTGGSAG